MRLYDIRNDQDTRVINPRPVCRANRHSMLDPANVWIKKSTGQRYCRACMKDKRQRDYQCGKEASQGFFNFGKLWLDGQLNLATLPQLREQKKAITKEVDRLANKFQAYQQHLKDVIIVYDLEVKRLADSTAGGEGPDGKVTG